MEQDVSPAAPALIDGRPEWDRISEEISCPLCEYNLRGLAGPQCPECGYRFQWPDLLDPARRGHSYLFELHPKNNFTSFWKTAFHGLRPFVFWNTLRAGQRCVPRRLMIYWAAVNLAVLLAFAAQVALLILRYNLNVRLWAATGGYALTTPHSIQWPSWDRYPWPWLITPLAIVLAWPWLTYLTLSIFQSSMRRAKVKQVHVLRCVVYCGDTFLWIALIALLLSSYQAIAMAFEPRASSRIAFYTSPIVTLMAPWPWMIAALVFGYRLVIAYWRYLRFRHVIATVLATQIIVALTVLAVASLLVGNLVRFVYIFDF